MKMRIAGEWTTSVLKRLRVGNLNFKHKNIHKCIREASGQDGVEVMRKEDLVLINKRYPKI